MVNSILKSLKSESEFKKLKLEGRKKRLEPWLLMVYLPSDKEFSSVGFSISSKYLNSVKRNRLRRVLRSCLRSVSDGQRSYLFHFIVTRKLTQAEWSLFNEKKSHYYLTQVSRSLDK